MTPNQDIRFEDSIKVWTGFAFAGFWKSAHLTLQDKSLILGSKNTKKRVFKIHVKVIDVKDKKKNVFWVKTGTDSFHFKTDSTKTKEHWLRIM